MILLDPPLDPTPDEARSALRRELLKPEYYDDNLVERLITWLRRQLDKGVEAAVDLPPLQTFAAMLIAVLLVGALVWLVRRARGSARAPRDKQSVLTDEAITAAELRARAEAALADGRHEDALVDAFRALAVRQVERGRLDDTPGATAHEVAGVLAREYPDRGQRVDTAAVLFDSVLYGDRPATREQALDVLTLDEDLAVLR
ncbi:MAG TPA: DUF4129 domain-containing protein [Actinophytocola sp.]|nr:DUF4129 domain-containing protein [Actinophytocola sp.]